MNQRGNKEVYSDQLHTCGVNSKGWGGGRGRVRLFVWVDSINESTRQ